MPTNGHDTLLLEDPEFARSCAILHLLRTTCRDHESQNCDSGLHFWSLFLGGRTSGTPSLEFCMCEVAPIFSELAPIFSEVRDLHVRPCRSGTRRSERNDSRAKIRNSELAVGYLTFAGIALGGCAETALVRSRRTPASEFQVCIFCRKRAEGAVYSVEHAVGAGIAYREMLTTSPRRRLCGRDARATLAGTAPVARASCPQEPPPAKKPI